MDKIYIFGWKLWAKKMMTDPGEYSAIGLEGAAPDFREGGGGLFQGPMIPRLNLGLWTQSISH